MMKYALILILFTPLISLSQLKLDWKNELTGNYTNVSGLIFLKDRIYITQTNDQIGSALSIFLPGGEQVHNSSTYVRIRSFFAYDNSLYSLGDQQLTKRSAGGTIVSEYKLPWKEGEYISSRNGKILKDAVYTTNIHNDFLKFSLNGEQLFRKEIGTMTDNHFLDVGSHFIYLYSSIFEPTYGGRLMQYDTLGNQKWSLALESVNNILADKDGNCYTFCVVTQKSNFVNKYNSEGKLLWSKEVPGQAIANGSLWADSLFVCGIESIDAANGEQQNPVFSILSAIDGKILYQQKLDFYQGEDEGYNESFTQIATDGKAIYLGGRTGAQGTKCFLVKLSKEGPTRLTEETKNTSFTIFPNPSGSKFTISCTDPSSSTLKVTVRNITGQIVRKETLSCNDKKSYELNLEKQPSGNYTVEIENGNKKVVKKVVVE